MKLTKYSVVKVIDILFLNLQLSKVISGTVWCLWHQCCCQCKQIAINCTRAQGAAGPYP